MMDTHTEEVLGIIRKNLHKYLNQHDIYIGHNNMIRCIHPDHEDKNPSCSVGGSTEHLFHCFSCGAAGDIFTAAHHLEGLPVHGYEFFTVTVPKLADKFGIKYEPPQLSEDAKAIFTMKKAHADAVTVLNNFVLRDWELDPAPAHVAMIKERGITLQSVKEWQIGAMSSVEEYESNLMKMGWSKSYLQEYNLIQSGIDKPEGRKIFVPDKIILPIHNHNGEPVAFVARYHKYTKETAKEFPKYVNSSTTDIYKKARTFYGLHLGKKSCQTKPLHIVEGYIDAITLRQAGFKNICALGSAELTDEHVPVLAEVRVGRAGNKVGVDSVVLAFDGDEGGRSCTETAIKHLSGDASVRVSVKQLPRLAGYSDPDEIARNHGLKAYERIEEFSTFKWTLMDSKERGQDEDTLVENACNLIKNEDSPLQRSRMAKELASVLSDNFNYHDIMEEVKKRREDHNSQLRTDVNVIIDQMIKKRTKHNVDLVAMLHDTYHQAKVKEKEYNVSVGDSMDAYSKQMNDVKHQCMTRTGDICGFKLNRFPMIQDAFDGFPDDECLFAIAGRPNVGKSSLMREIGWDIAKSNKDAFVIYMSIDDSTRDVLQAIVAGEANHSRDKIYKYAVQEDPVRDAVDLAWSRVEKRKNYAVFDVTQGNTLMHLHEHVDYVRQMYPDKKPILFLDNFHKLSSNQSTDDRRGKFVDLSSAIKEMTTSMNIPVVMTVEMKKGYGRPRADEIAETVQLEYDCKIIGLVHQELHSKPDTQVKWVRDNYDNKEMVMPYLEMQIYKNKYTGFKGYLGYKFETDKSILHEVPSYHDEINKLYDRDKDSRARKEHKERGAFV